MPNNGHSRQSTQRMWEGETLQDQERHNIARDTTATAYNKDTPKARTTEGHTTSHTIEREDNTTNNSGVRSTTHHQTCSWALSEVHPGGDYWRRESTGREFTSSHAQHLTHQSRDMTGQTSSRSYAGDRERYNQ